MEKANMRIEWDLNNLENWQQDFIDNYQTQWGHLLPAYTADNIIFAKGAGKPKLLLIQRGGEPYAGSWAFPGGFANPNEDPKATALRELEEETGIAGFPEELMCFVGTYEGYTGRDPRGDITSSVFVSVIPNELGIEQLDDASNACWWPVSDIPWDDLAFDHADILDAAFPIAEEMGLYD